MPILELHRKAGIVPVKRIVACLALLKVVVKVQDVSYIPLAKSLTA